ncbi:MAG: hypothetical protein ACKORI_04295, partial [Verrucomicrobiota bacterium]
RPPASRRNTSALSLKGRPALMVSGSEHGVDAAQLEQCVAAASSAPFPSEELRRIDAVLGA